MYLPSSGRILRGVGRQQPERYEPLPGLAEWPGWIWGKMGRRSRIALALVLITAVGLAVALGPGIVETKREAAEAERRERAGAEARRIRELRAELRPRFGRTDSAAPAGAGPEQLLAARADVMDGLVAAILRDA
ncbi:MAG: hypothetical protein ICV69_15145, partial [Thermoleophilaceae bacterium]|nr:hypothetical protein [Thermoleophilaceae bacterium]